MARQTIVRLTDDFDGTVAATTVRFSWDGVGYEIDLSTAHAEAFAAVVQPYVEAARRVGRPRRGARPAARAGAGAPPGAGELAAIRVWARENHVRVADRGRIATDVIEAYRAAQREARPASEGAPTMGATDAPRQRATPPRKTTRARPTTTSRRSPATSPVAKKTVAKKTAARRGTATSASARTAAKKTAAKKTAAKKTAAKKTVRKSATKVPGRKRVARKPS